MLFHKGDSECWIYASPKVSLKVPHSMGTWLNVVDRKPKPHSCMKLCLSLFWCKCCCHISVFWLFIWIKAIAGFVAVQNVCNFFFFWTAFLGLHLNLCLAASKLPYLVFLTLLMCHTSGGSQGLHRHRRLSVLAAKGVWHQSRLILFN